MPIEYLKNIFGINYVLHHNLDDLAFYFGKLRELKNSLTERIVSFLEESREYQHFHLETWELDLLLMDTNYQNTQREIPFISYYSAKELSLIDLLKRITDPDYEIDKESYQELFHFINNHNRVDSIIESSKGSNINLDYHTLKKLYKLICSRRSTAGNNIFLYEGILREFNITQHLAGPALELKAS